MSIKQKYRIELELNQPVRPIDLKAKQRTDFDIQIEVKRDGVAEDLTGVIPSITYGPADGAYAISVTGSVTDAANGICVISPTTTDTDYTGSHELDVILTDTSDTAIHKVGHLILDERAAGDTAGTVPSGTNLDWSQYATHTSVLSNGPYTAGTNIVFGTADAQGRIAISADITAAGGRVDSVVAGTGIAVDATDPVNPIVSAYVTEAPQDGNQYARKDAGWEQVPADSTEFADNVFRVQDNVDATKELAFEVSGVTTATTRTVTVPDKSGKMALLSDIKQGFQMVLVDDETDLTVEDGIGSIRLVIPSELNGANLISVQADVYTAGTTGLQTVQVHNVTQAVDMLSTAITIDSGETSSATAATPPVIDTANDDVATGDQIRIDSDTIHTTAAKGLSVTLVFQIP